jgi:FkbM family methyltransferase
MPRSDAVPRVPAARPRHQRSFGRPWSRGGRAAGALLAFVLAACGGPSGTETMRGTGRAAAPDAAAIGCPVRGPFGPSSGYHSQFYEDYVLAYVFRDVKKGVYVDVGANDPDLASVTKYFYAVGWRGISFEPIPELAEKLARARPEDINLGIGISDTVTELTFYKAQHSGLSTFDAEVMRRHQASGIAFDEIGIPVSTLTAIFDRHPLVHQGIHFMNVDVEGYEKQVLSGLDFTRYHPRVIMAESTAPLTETATHGAWEPILTAAGYVFAMDDGLNRYYVHSSQPDLLPRFLEINYCVGLDKLAKRIKLDGFKALDAR